MYSGTVRGAFGKHCSAMARSVMTRSRSGLYSSLGLVTSMVSMAFCRIRSPIFPMVASFLSPWTLTGIRSPRVMWASSRARRSWAFKVWREKLYWASVSSG